MKIVERRKVSFQVACNCGHAFPVPRRSISVECPHCGRTEILATLIAKDLETPTANAA